MPRTLLITPLVDPTLDRVGFPLEHRYVEQVWLSIAGPSAVLFLRHCGRTLEAEPAGVRVDLVDLSRSLGLQARDGAELGRSSHLVRTLDRVVQFRLAAWVSEDRLAVNRRVPAVTASRVERLPARVQALHHQLLTEHLQGLVAAAETGPVGSTTSAERLAAIGRTTEPNGHTRSVSR